MGVILQSADKWSSFVEAMKEALGDNILSAAHPPSPNEIHFD